MTRAAFLVCLFAALGVMPEARAEDYDLEEGSGWFGDGDGESGAGDPQLYDFETNGFDEYDAMGEGDWYTEDYYDDDAVFGRSVRHDRGEAGNREQRGFEFETDDGGAFNDWYDD